MKRVLAAGIAALCAFSLPSAAAAPRLDFGATKNRNLDSGFVTIGITNTTDKRIELFGGSIRTVRTKERQARLVPDTRFLRPGERHEWDWLHEGDSGRFRATFRTSVGRVRDTFDVGAYFTIGFRCDDTPDNPCYDPFVIWVRGDNALAELRADLAQPQDSRRIVSGIVRRPKPYNSAWSYTMGSGSIVLGEVFIEVCDANPMYVEENRDDWIGDRWCPWLSYVAAEGR